MDAGARFTVKFEFEFEFELEFEFKFELEVALELKYSQVVGLQRSFQHYILH